MDATVPNPGPAVGETGAPLVVRPPLRQVLGHVHRVVVLRALMLGDLLCATPALRALRQGLPQAHIALVGLPAQRALVERLASVDEFIPFPGWPGLPESPPADARAQLQFLVQLRRRRFDLALQLHGSGGVVNPLVASFGARRCAGFADAEAWRPEDDAASFTDWPVAGTEVERLLALTDHLGLPRQGTRLDFPLHAADREAAQALLAPLGARPFVVVHPGSQLASRRWSPERFAAVADALATALAPQGLAVVLTGSADEGGLTAAVAAAMRTPAFDAAGQTSLFTLGAVVERALGVVCNDTGLSHVAAALGTPSVVVASGSEVARWAPADALRHRVLWHDVECRPCGHAVCPLPGHPCASGVAVHEVQAAALAMAHARLAVDTGAGAAAEPPPAP